MKRVVLTGSLIMAAATFSFAGTPKGEAKDAKTETTTTTTTTEVKAQQESITYYVTGQTTISGTVYYTVQTTQPAGCGSGSLPCRVLSSEEKDGNNRIPVDAVEEVQTFRTSY
jgi:hypothetical protein